MLAGRLHVAASWQPGGVAHAGRPAARGNVMAAGRRGGPPAAGSGNPVPPANRASSVLVAALSTTSLISTDRRRRAFATARLLRPAWAPTPARGKSGPGAGGGGPVRTAPGRPGALQRCVWHGRLPTLEAPAGRWQLLPGREGGWGAAGAQLGRSWVGAPVVPAWAAARASVTCRTKRWKFLVRGLCTTAGAAAGAWWRIQLAQAAGSQGGHAGVPRHVGGPCTPPDTGVNFRRLLILLTQLLAVPGQRRLHLSRVQGCQAHILNAEQDSPGVGISR